MTGARLDRPQGTLDRSNRLASEAGDWARLIAAVSLVLDME
jgi:hypothetical protein